MLKIPEMTMFERAFDYPYSAPDGAFLLQGGFVRDLPLDYDFDNRTAVLSVGSNRSPAQLYRKFGGEAEIAVTAVRVHDCDIVHVANLAPYAAVPCSAFPSKGTSVQLNIAWLDRAQLDVMHATESLGVAYDWVEWDMSVIEPLGFSAPKTLYGYAAIAGAFNLSGQGPLGLCQIPAENRVFAEKSQADMQGLVFDHFCMDDLSLAGWVERLQTDSELR